MPKSPARLRYESLDTAAQKEYNKENVWQAIPLLQESLRLVENTPALVDELKAAGISRYPVKRSRAQLRRVIAEYAGRLSARSSYEASYSLYLQGLELFGPDDSPEEALYALDTTVSALGDAKKLKNVVKINDSIRELLLGSSGLSQDSSTLKRRFGMAQKLFDAGNYQLAQFLFEINLKFYEGHAKHSGDVERAKDKIEGCKIMYEATRANRHLQVPDPRGRDTVAGTEQRSSSAPSVPSSQENPSKQRSPERTLSAQNQSRSRSTEVSTTHTQPGQAKETSSGSFSQTSVFSSSDKWFKDLERSHDLLRDLPRKGRRRVRIAVLDTGIDGKLSVFNEDPDKRVIAYKDFTEKDSKDSFKAPGGLRNDFIRDKCLDVCGHGSECTALVMKVVDEWGEVCIARVSTDEEGHPLPEAVVAAIKHANSIWEVDIISMSFGFKDWLLPLERAAREVYSNNVLMFAAASNDGKRTRAGKSIMWPAKQSCVICVNSASESGSPSSDLNAPSENDKNFTALGVDIASAAERVDECGNLLRLSGSSYATAIAAGTAALFISFARQTAAPTNGSVDNAFATADRLKSPDNMRALFRQLQSKSDGFYYTAPWFLLDNTYTGKHKTPVAYAAATIMEALPD